MVCIKFKFNGFLSVTMFGSINILECTEPRALSGWGCFYTDYTIGQLCSYSVNYTCVPNTLTTNTPQKSYKTMYILKTILYVF